MQEVRAYSDRVAPEWDRLREGYFTEEVRKEIVGRAELHSGMQVADVGCGTGFLAEALVPLAAKVHCLDASVQMVEQARRRLGSHPNVRFHLVEGIGLPRETESVDAAVACMYLHHVAEPEHAMAEMGRILRPGGRLVLADLDERGEEWMRAEMARHLARVLARGSPRMARASRSGRGGRGVVRPEVLRRKARGRAGGDRHLRRQREEAAAEALVARGRWSPRWTCSREG